MCIDPWLSDHHTCPMCKLDVIKALGYWVCCLLFIFSLCPMLPEGYGVITDQRSEGQTTDSFSEEIFLFVKNEFLRYSKKKKKE